MEGLDLDRGVIVKFHPSGMQIATYPDDPGTYYDVRGAKVPPELAKQAHFDVERHQVEKLKLEAVAKYRAQLDRELATQEEQIAAALSSGDLQVRHIGAGQYAIFRDGERVTKLPLSLADCKLFVGAAGGDVSAVKIVDEDTLGAGRTAQEDLQALGLDTPAQANPNAGTFEDVLGGSPQ